MHGQASCFDLGQHLQENIVKALGAIDETTRLNQLSAKFDPMKCLPLIIVLFGATTQLAAQQPNTLNSTPLFNTHWRLVTVDHKNIRINDGTKEIHIQLDSAANQLTGFAGCNRLMGNFTLSGTDGIRVQSATTKMFCEEATMEVESSLLNAFAKTTRYQIQGNQLLLLKKRKVVAVFEAVYF